MGAGVAMTDERRMKESAWVIAWRWGTAILVAVATGVGSYAMMWVKVNAPTRPEFAELVKSVTSLREDLIRRAEFAELVKSVTSLREDLIRRESQEGRLDNHEKRIERLEEDNRRRFPARGAP